MNKFSIAGVIAAATAAYCIVRLASSMASRRQSAKAVVKRGQEIIATTSHDLSVSPG